MVPLETLALAHWRQSLFRSIVTARQNNGSPGPPGVNASTTTLSSTAPPEIGIVVTTKEIGALLEKNRDVVEEASQKAYFPVFRDSSLRTGDYLSMDSGEPADYTSDLMTAMEQLDGMSASKPSSPLRRAADESTFFGVASSKKIAKIIVKEDVSGTAKWTEYEPIRYVDKTLLCSTRPVLMGLV